MHITLVIAIGCICLALRELELYKVPVNRRKMVKKPVLLNLPTP